MNANTNLVPLPLQDKSKFDNLVETSSTVNDDCIRSAKHIVAACKTVSSMSDGSKFISFFYLSEFIETKFLFY